MTLQRLLTAALGCCAVEKKQWISICVSFDFQAFVFPSQDTRKFSQPVNDLFIIYHRFSKLVFPFHSSRCVTTQSDLQRYRTAYSEWIGYPLTAFLREVLCWLARPQPVLPLSLWQLGQAPAPLLSWNKWKDMDGWIYYYHLSKSSD